MCTKQVHLNNELETVVNKILEIRGRRKKYINKKKFDRDLIHNAWKHYFKEEKNFHEYADMNLMIFKCKWNFKAIWKRNNCNAGI